MALTQISTAGVKDDLVTAAKIADDAVTEALISDDSVDEARLKISNAGSNGQYLQKQSGNTGGLTWATVSAGISDIVSDTSPQLGGDLDTNSFEISLDDDHKIKWGDGDDLQIYHDGSHSHIKNNTGYIKVLTDSFAVNNNANSENIISALANGAVNLYYDDSKKFETLSDGVKIDGILHWDSGNSGRAIELLDNQKIFLGTGTDLQIFHSGGENFIRGNASASPLYIDCCENLHIRHLDTDGSNSETMIKAIGDGAVELYYLSLIHI